ncbi:hypothetical protein Taro_032843 [Colocasia esculenta]|uniref:Uncharacterized protein n=1 Tax=Colocasia esculenta TaxID=4460 RepID=A0A843VYF6_COLES|nr:hypothetical protein [Colocasia esculenta]
MEDGMPGSVAEEGGIERDNGTPEKDVPLNVEANGDLTHEEQLGKGFSEADGIRVSGAHGLSPGSVGPSQIVAEMNGDPIRAEKVGTPQGSTPAESPPVGVASGASASPTSATPTKGYGLRKWRRIRRDLSRDGGTIADASRILKRGLSITDPPKVKDEDKQKHHYEGESSVASVESRNIQSPPNSTATARALDTELELLGAVGNFSVGIDSETSDDRSSRFSTAASGPRSKLEGSGYGKDKNRVRNLGGKGSGHAAQSRGQRGKGSAVDVTKKLREDQLSFEKENSHSSIESDLRSSAAVFAQWAGTTSNGRQSEGSLNYDGENGGEAQVSEEVQEGFHKGTGVDIEDTSRKGSHADIPVEDKTEESENYPPDQGADPFVESIMLLQEAQEALEKGTSFTLGRGRRQEPRFRNLLEHPAFGVFALVPFFFLASSLVLCSLL